MNLVGIVTITKDPLSDAALEEAERLAFEALSKQEQRIFLRKEARRQERIDRGDERLLSKIEAQAARELGLPRDADLKYEGKLIKASWDTYSAFFYIIKDNVNKWVAYVDAPRRTFTRLETIHDAKIKKITPRYIKNKRTVLENAGLTFDARGRLIAPHVTCGVSPFTEPEEEE